MRKSNVKRETAETSVEIKVNLDGKGKYSVESPSGFLKHMLELFSKHSGIDMAVKITGDTEVDMHHTVEDTAIVMGQTIKKALGQSMGIERYGWSMLVMDEVRCDVALDLSGRPNMVYNVDYPGRWDGPDDFDYDLIKEFIKALADNLKATIHINKVYGTNNHHIAEAVFKGLAKSLKMAVEITGEDIPSTKGKI
ncbi:MAG: imidazoleglycerol-phosphate dehydratase HisB [Elusimicrobia bacterium]|jgi:imidazoleglycerol-phosphate dehydratase|nr:imidazoleglycerol-phosphate dehydratase HisB [Elusimicrobiota bacterium]